MGNQYTQLGWALATAASIAVPGVLHAADSGRKIEEVIVTAERKEASIQDTSISITAFTDQFIDDFGIRNQEDLQNFVPATTIQPYDATIRGVGRNFRALGGDPGVATYMNGVYSEDLLTATAATFWDVARIEVLRGPQGTLYGRNAVGGAINILYKEPTYEAEHAFRAIVGNFGTQEYYGMVSGALYEDKLAGRLNFSLRDRDGVIEEIGPSENDLDGLGTDNIAVQLKWNPTDTFQVDLRQNIMEIDRSFGGANGGGLVVLNEETDPTRNTTSLVPGYRRVDPAQTNPVATDFLVPGAQMFSFTDPVTGAAVAAQPNRAGMDFFDGNGFQNAAASLDGFNNTSAASAAAYNRCVFSGDIKGDEICAATNGLNQEEFDQQGTQITAAWEVSENLLLKYIYGYNKLSYRRTTDDDNTASQFHDRQFYVNHEADYSSHELQAFYDFSENFSVTSGIFFYDATIDQRGDFYSSVGSDRYETPFVDNTSLSAAASALTGIPAGLSMSQLVGGAAAPVATLYSAKNNCLVANPSPTCERNYSVTASNADLSVLNGGDGTRSDNLVFVPWRGDDGTNPDLDVLHGPNTRGSDLLYATQTVREAFAAYTQAVWDINDTFTLTAGIRYASDEVTAEENLWRYSESDLNGALGLYSSAFTATPSGGSALYDINVANGGFLTDAAGDIIFDANGQPTPNSRATNGGGAFAASVYRPFFRKDTKTTGRINLDWNINDSAMMYFSATSGYRSGGYNLVFFSTTAAYDPEELIAYEIGYKTQFLNDTLQLNGSFYFYDYDTIHTVATEVSSIGGLSTSVLEAPGAKISGIEAEALWLATDNLTLGGNFSFTPSEYTEDLFIKDTAGFDKPDSLFPGANQNVNINGNQLLQVPEVKYTAFGSYRVTMSSGSNLDFSSTYSWVDEVYYSPFENDREKAPSYGRTDLRVNWTSADDQWVVSAFVNNVFDDVGILQVLRNGEDEFFRQSAGTTLPRLYGMEFTYMTGK
ncbi:MAG: outer membrane receptor protein involved in Fe transport [Candidatus Azotimanducaceae bacterium]|jgi:outer membrane receptor protein involved in Fe transport